MRVLVTTNEIYFKFSGLYNFMKRKLHDNKVTFDMKSFIFQTESLKWIYQSNQSYKGIKSIFYYILLTHFTTYLINKESSNIVDKVFAFNIGFLQKLKIQVFNTKKTKI